MPQPELGIALLGPVNVTLAGEDVKSDLYAKPQALLAYLAMIGGSHPREVIAGMFWGDKTDARALHNLRVNLTQAENVIGKRFPRGRQTLAFDRQSNYWLDVEAFEAGWQRSRLPDGRFDVDELRQAVELYRGPFMDDISLPDAPTFEEWQYAQRGRLEEIAVTAFDRLIDHCIRQADYVDGLRFARRLLEITPWREEAHRQMMTLLANAGRFSDALAQYELCRTVLREELGVKPTPETERLIADIRALRARQKQPATPKLHLVAPGTQPPFLAPGKDLFFTGRTAELAELAQNIQDAERPYRLALVGMGGVGKTLLATHLAHAVRDAFPDGVLWANAADDPKRIAEVWANAYGYDFSSLPGLEERAAALRAVLAEKEALLALDDPQAAAKIRPLLPTQGRCVTLFTTRDADVARRLQAQIFQLAVLPTQDGYALLTRIVGAERVQAEAASAERICRLLENLPLALAIAGKHLDYRQRRSLADYAQRLAEERQRLNALQAADTAVRTSFAISWQALDDTQKWVFALLGVFNGRSFAENALAALAQINTYVAQDRLDDLTKLSLLNAEGRRRYRQHPLLADFAREQIRPSDPAFRLMAEHYLEVAQKFAQEYAVLGQEWDNLAAGIETAHKLMLWPTVLGYTAALREAWFARGRYSEALSAYEFALRAALALEDDAAYGRTLLHLSHACLELNQYAAAEKHLRQAYDVFSDLGQADGVADTLHELARLALEQNRFEDAQQALERSQSIYAELGRQQGLARSLYRLARSHYRQGKPQDALRECERALEVLREIKPQTPPVQRDMIPTLRLLSQCHSVLHQPEPAATYIRQAADLARELEELGELAAVLNSQAILERKQNNLAGAREHAEQALSLNQKMGLRNSQALTLRELSRIYFELDQCDLAFEYGKQSLVLAEDLGDAFLIALNKIHLGDVHHTTGATEIAHKFWRAAEEIAQGLQQGPLLKALNKRLSNLDENGDASGEAEASS